MLRHSAAGFTAVTTGLLLSLFAFPHSNAEPTQVIVASRPTLALNSMRSSASDLEVGGQLAGLPPGTTRYVTLASLLALPLETYDVSDDSNFAGPTKISGVRLENLLSLMGADPAADLVVAICDDKYLATYSRAYMKAYDPLLVLRVNGELAPGWPKDPESHSDMGPYMISHPNFSKKSQSTSFSEQPQIPWGVVRLEFRDEQTVFGAITPPASTASDRSVQQGYGIARNYCYHCHNAGDQGGQKARRSWRLLAAVAASSPDFFSAYVRDPKSQNASAQMPANPNYDEPTLRALSNYFATFAPSTKP